MEANSTKVIEAEREDDNVALHNEYAMTTKAFAPIESALFESGVQEGSAWHQELQANMNLMTLKGLLFNEDWVFILIDRIASKIAAQELKVVQERVVDGKATYEPADRHPVQELLYSPNKHQTYYDWMYCLVADACIAGNAICWLTGTTGELYHVPIEMIQADFDVDGGLNNYRMVQYNFESGIPIMQAVASMTADSIAHIRRPNPSSAVWGLSPFVPGRRSVLFNRYSQEYLNNFYVKGAQPGMVFDMNDVANEKAALRLLRTIESVHTGRRNQRRNMILPKGVKMQPGSNQTLADQQLKDYVLQNRETIINILQVPKHELSIANAGSLGSEEYKTALRNFWKGPLKSQMRAIEMSLGKLLASRLGRGYYLQFDLSDVDVLQEDMNQKADLSIKLLQTHTLNEVRAKVFEEGPLDGGDKTPGQATAQPGGIFGMALPPGKEQTEAPPPDTTNPVDHTAELVTPEDAPQEDERSKVLESNMFIWNDLKAKEPTWWKRREETLTKDYDKDFAAIHKTTLELFADQITTAFPLIKSQLRNQGIKSMATKAEFRKTPLKRALRAALDKFEERWISDMTKVIESRVDLGFNAQLVLPFNLPNQAEIMAAKERNKARLDDMIEGRLAETFSNINATTTEKIMRVVEDAVANSRTADQAAQSIASIIGRNLTNDFTDPEQVNSRAMLIAQQEIMTASSLGQAAALEIAAETDPTMMKMWIAAGDDRVRGNPGGKYPEASADHWHLSGEVVPWDKDFVDSRGNKLAFPRDPKGDPGAIMRCRCTFVMVPKAEADKVGIRSLAPEFQNP